MDAKAVRVVKKDCPKYVSHEIKNKLTHQMLRSNVDIVVAGKNVRLTKDATILPLTQTIILNLTYEEQGLYPIYITHEESLWTLPVTHEMYDGETAVIELTMQLSKELGQSNLLIRSTVGEITVVIEPVVETVMLGKVNLSKEADYYFILDALKTRMTRKTVQEDSLKLVTVAEDFFDDYYKQLGSVTKSVVLQLMQEIYMLATSKVETLRGAEDLVQELQARYQQLEKIMMDSISIVGDAKMKQVNDVDRKMQMQHMSLFMEML